MFDIHLILNQFDDGEDEVGIAQPAEHIVEDGHILVLHALGDTMTERRQYHAGHRRLDGFHLACHGKGIVIGSTRHTDDQVDAGLVEHMACLLYGTHLCEDRRETHAQFGILIKDLLVYASVVLQHKGIIGVGHDEHVEDAAGHQVHKRDIFQIKGIEFLWYICHMLFAILGLRVQRYVFFSEKWVLKSEKCYFLFFFLGCKLFYS